MIVRKMGGPPGAPTGHPPSRTHAHPHSSGGGGVYVLDRAMLSDPRGEGDGEDRTSLSRASRARY